MRKTIFALLAASLMLFLALGAVSVGSKAVTTTIKEDDGVAPAGNPLWPQISGTVKFIDWDASGKRIEVDIPGATITAISNEDPTYTYVATSNLLGLQQGDFDMKVAPGYSYTVSVSHPGYTGASSRTTGTLHLLGLQKIHFIFSQEVDRDRDYSFANGFFQKLLQRFNLNVPYFL